MDRRGLGLIAVLALLACTQRPTPAGVCGLLGEPCCADDSCPGELVCREGLCIQGQSELGRACARNGDCTSGFCVDLGAGRTVCSVGCADGGGCLSGWTCGASVCRCTPSDEICDGRDNDCDGQVDEAPAVDDACVQSEGPRHVCFQGTCIGAACASTADCLGDQRCNPVTGACELPDGGSNQDGGGPRDCFHDEPGTIESVGVCVGCTHDLDCAPPPYGGGYVCTDGLCQNGCNVTQCESVCTGQGLLCDTSACQCVQFLCTDQDCHGTRCTGSNVCDALSCTCTSPPPPDCTQTGCLNGELCVSSAAGQPAACGGTGSRCAKDCSVATCPTGWDCVDYSLSSCTASGLTSGQFCERQCTRLSDCEGSGEQCCWTLEGLRTCSLLPECITQ